jgi:hypothetical protein
VVLIVVAAVIGITVIFGTYAAVRGPDVVDRLRVVNDTPYLLDVEVTGGGRDGWLELGPVSPGERHDFASVVDQGERWVFHVTSGSHDGGEFSMSRAALARARWQVTIPPTVQSRLEGSGAVPHPST